MPTFQIQTEAAQIWLGIFNVLVSGPTTYQGQYHTICNDYFQKKPVFTGLSKEDRKYLKIRKYYLGKYLKAENSFVKWNT